MAAALGWGWAILVGAGLLRLGRDLNHARRLRADATPAPKDVQETFERLRRRLGMRPGVGLASSSDLSAPVVLGPWRPLVLLPSEPGTLRSDQELEMALAHELLHVRRWDLWLGIVPQLTRILFPFHPLARLAAREERLAREAACDAAVLRALGRAPREYGRLLLRFGAVPSVSGAAQGAPTFRSLRRRLQMLDHANRSHGRALAMALIAAGLVALVPFTAVAHPRPADPDAEVVFDGDVDVDVDADVDVDLQRDAAIDERGDAFIVSHGENATMFASLDKDFAIWKRLAKNEHGDLFYFRHADKAWVTRDPAVLAEVHRVIEPLQMIGDQQGRIGDQQGALGDKQGLLGEQQGKLGERMALLAGDSAEQHRLQTDMDALGRQMDALGREMDVLGRDMDALGREMDEASVQIRQELGRIAEDAVRRGVAQPLTW